MANEFFDLNANRLDEEWVNQVSLYHQHALALADASRDYEIAKTATELAHAEASTKIRRADPEDYGYTKWTEDAIKASITVEKGYRKAVLAEIDAKHAKEVASIAVQTLDQKKFALMKLTDLRLADYFSEPVASKEALDTTREWERQKFNRRQPKSNR